MKKAPGIIITPTGYMYKPGSSSLVKKLSQDEYRDFQFYMADMLCYEFERAIDSQRYKHDVSKWPPLSFKYLTWKKSHNLSLKIWEATGTLKSNLKIFRKGSFIAVGFKQADVYPKSRLKINNIARYLEYGTNNSNGKVRIPPRPLFRPITVYMRKHINDYYKKYQKELKSQNKKFLYL